MTPNIDLSASYTQIPPAVYRPILILSMLSNSLIMEKFSQPLNLKVLSKLQIK